MKTVSELMSKFSQESTRKTLMDSSKHLNAWTVIQNGC